MPGSARLMSEGIVQTRGRWLRDGLLDALLTVLVVAGVFAWLVGTRVPWAMSRDGARDVLMVRDCLENGYCPMSGNGSSVPGFFHGGTWNVLIAAAQLAGGAEQLHSLMLFTVAVAAGALFRVARRLVGTPEALGAVLVFAAMATAWDAAHPKLANPTPALFFNALVCLLLVEFARTLDPARGIVAGLVAGLAAGLRIEGLAYAPVLLVVVTAVRGGRFAVLVLGAFAVPLAATSLASLLAALARHPWWVGPAYGVLIALASLVGHAARRFVPATGEGRAWFAVAFAGGPVVAAQLVLPAVGLQRTLGETLHLDASLLALAFAGFAWAPSRRWPRLRWCVCVAALGAGAALVDASAPGSPLGPYLWRESDLTPLAQRLAPTHGYDALAGSLQAPHCRSLLAGLATRLPRPELAPSAPGPTVRLLRVPAPLAPPDWPAGDAIAVESGVALVAPIVSWVGASNVRLCAGGDGQDCRPRRTGEADTNFYFSSRAFPALFDPPPTSGEASFVYPLEATGAGARIVDVLAFEDGGRCRPRVSAVKGLSTRTALPGDRVELEAPGPMKGELVLSVPPGCGATFPPCLFETAPAEDALRKALATTMRKANLEGFE